MLACLGDFKKKKKNALMGIFIGTKDKTKAGGKKVFIPINYLISLPATRCPRKSNLLH